MERIAEARAAARHEREQREADAQEQRKAQEHAKRLDAAAEAMRGLESLLVAQDFAGIVSRWSELLDAADPLSDGFAAFCDRHASSSEWGYQLALAAGKLIAAGKFKQAERLLAKDTGDADAAECSYLAGVFDLAARFVRYGNLPDVPPEKWHQQDPSNTERADTFIRLTDTKTDTPKTLTETTRDDEPALLVKRMERIWKTSPNRTEKEIALEFTDGDEQMAENYLRTIRRNAALKERKAKARKKHAGADSQRTV